MVGVFLNHLCDGERFASAISNAFNFLNHLCDGEPCHTLRQIAWFFSKPSMRWRTIANNL
ncbi:hypothetical protein ENHYDAX1_220290 [Enhydrobacter sp. AX1]|nr:hypothetical protein ENHYDAX1_220290 [Enhydrobacter sp. AX1]